MIIEKTTANKEIPILKDLSDDEQASLVSNVRKRFLSWQASSTGWRSKVINKRKAWYSGLGGYEKEDIIYNEDEDLEIPMFYSSVEGIVTQAASVIFPNGDKFFNPEPNGQNDIEFVDTMKKTMLYYINKMKFRQKFLPVIRSGMRDGIFALKVKWVEDKQPVRSRHKQNIAGGNRLDDTGQPIPIYDIDGKPRVDELTGEPMYQKLPDKILSYITEEEVTFKDQPDFEPIDILSLTIDPLAKDLDSCNIFQRKFVSYQYLESQNSDEDIVYGNLDKLEHFENNETATRASRYDVKYATKDTGIPGGSNTTDTGIDKDSAQTLDNIELYEYYGDVYYTKDNGDKLFLKNYLVVLANNGMDVIRFEPSPFSYDGVARKHPFVLSPCIVDSDDVAAARGVCDAMIPSQKHMNTIIKAVVALTERKVRGRYEGIDGEIDDKTIDTLQNSNGCFIEVPYHGAIAPFKEENNYQIPIEMIGMLKREAQEGAPMTSMFLGNSDRTRRTKMEQGVRANMVSDKVGVLLISLDYLLQDTLLAIYELIKTCMSDSIWIRLNEDENITLKQVHDWEIAETSFDFTITTISESINRQEITSSLEQWLNFVGKTPAADQINWKFVNDTYARSLRLPQGQLMFPKQMITVEQAQQQTQQAVQEAIQQAQQTPGLQPQGVPPVPLPQMQPPQQQPVPPQLPPQLPMGAM